MVDRADSEARNYLAQHGYQHASRSRASAIGIDGLLEQALSSDGGMHEPVGLRLGLHLHPEQEGPGYVESFRRWSEWLDGSSASLQRELSGLRFPILLHCFIGIACRLGDMAPARRFLQEHAPKLRDEAQRAAASTLEKLQHAAQLQEHEGARRYLVHRTTVFCSPEAWEALVAFLTASQLPLLLRVLTRHFDVFAVASDTPSRASPSPPAATGPDPEAGVAAAAAARSEGGAPYSSAPSSSAAATTAPLPPPPRASPPPPSVCLITQASSHTSLCCTDVSPLADGLVCGRADGALQFCRFSQSAATQSRFAASGVDLESRCRVVPGHSGPVYSVALSRNLQHVLSGSQDGSVRLWSWQQAACLATYRNHGYPVWHVCLASHQSHFLSCCHDGGLRLFDTQRLSPLRLMAGHLADVTAATFHASDAYALSASQDGTLRLWDTSASSCVRLLLGHSGPVTAAAVTPAAAVAASGSEDQTVRLWDLGSGRATATLPHGEPVSSVAFSSDGRLLASVGARQLRVWNWEAAVGRDGGAEPVLCCDSPVPLIGASFLRDSSVCLGVGVGEVA